MKDPNVTPEEQAILDDLLSGLDFEKIVGYMAMTGWKYWNTPCPPTQEQLRETAVNCVLRVMRGTKVTASRCGGFLVEYYNPSDEPHEIAVSFIAQSHSINWKRRISNVNK